MMDPQFINNVEKKRLYKSVLAATFLLAVFLGIKALGALKELSYIGKGVYPSNVISVVGKGEVLAIPDTGSFYFSVVETAKTVPEAQEKSAKKINAVMDALKDLGIEEKDIKTTGYNSYPKYEYRQSVCRPIPLGEGYAGITTNPSSPYYCPSGKNVLIGYEVSQTVTVKIRKTSDAGAVLTKVGTLGVSNLSGLDFVVDDMEKVKVEARDKAIKDAKEKAKILSKSLGVRLSKIVSFYEGGDYAPVYYGMEMSAKGIGGDMPRPTVPEIPVGEDTIVSNITINYEIE